jgi:hypothetical protein
VNPLREYVVTVQVRAAAAVADVWQLVVDTASWRAFPGADVEYRMVDQLPHQRFDYEVLTGLPTRNHHGRVELASMAPASTEIVWSENFRPRTVGTGGFLRTRVESHLAAAAREIAERSES